MFIDFYFLYNFLLSHFCPIENLNSLKFLTIFSYYLIIMKLLMIHLLEIV